MHDIDIQIETAVIVKFHFVKNLSVWKNILTTRSGKLLNEGEILKKMYDMCT